VLHDAAHAASGGDWLLALHRRTRAATGVGIAIVILLLAPALTERERERERERAVRDPFESPTAAPTFDSRTSSRRLGASSSSTKTCGEPLESR
jgi:hypothetical protein